MNISLDDLKELAGHNDADHWLVDDEAELNGSDEVNELLQTGSVTTSINGQMYVIALSITQEAT